MILNQISLLLYTLFILETLQRTNSQKINDDYERLEPEKFQARLNWTIDSLNINTDHSSYSFFWYKQNAACFVIKIDPTGSSSLIITILMVHFAQAFTGTVHGKILKLLENYYANPGCPDEKEIHFLYTDYTNVVVLLGYDEWAGPHIMILKSQSTNLTYEERMKLVESKVKGLFDFKSLKKVEGWPSCNMTLKDMDDFKRVQYRKCKKIFQLMKSERL